MKKLTALIACLMVLVPCLLVSGCSSSLPASANQSISYQLTQEPITLDPQVASDSAAVVVVEALFEGLVRLDTNNNPYPGVAKSWTSNADHTQFTFSLREDAVWSNGDPVTAHDFVYAFQRALTPSTGSTTASSMYCIKNAKQVHAGTLSPSELGVSALDSHTLVINLEYSYEDFPSLTATAPFMPCNQSFFESTEGQYCLEAKFILGNGPFVMDNRYAWTHGESIKLSRSSSYVGDQPVYPSSLNFTIKSYELTEAFQLLMDGDTDAAPIASSSLESAKQAGCTITAFQDTTWGLCFNTSSELMKHTAIRKAFVQTLNRDALLRHLPKNTAIANDIINPDTTFLGQSYRSQAGSDFYLKQDDSSLQAAIAVLPSLNLETMPSVTVLCPDTNEAKRMVNEMIATWNAKMGNYFNMEPLSEDALAKRVANGNYDVALCPIRTKGQEPSQLLSLFQSDSESNPAFLKDPAYDALLASAESSKGNESLSHYVAAEKYLNDQCVFYPLYYESRYYAAAPGVSGVVFHPYDTGIDFIRAGKE